METWELIQNFLDILSLLVLSGPTLVVVAVGI